MVWCAGSSTGTVYADVTFIPSKVKVKVTELLNFRKLPMPCMHPGGDDLPGLSGCVIVNIVCVYHCNFVFLVLCCHIVFFLILSLLNLLAIRLNGCKK